jgi:Ran GTPase-activating protein (RanGAP) involved in mRNA processing and transport
LQAGTPAARRNLQYIFRHGALDKLEITKRLSDNATRELAQLLRDENKTITKLVFLKKFHLIFALAIDLGKKVTHLDLHEMAIRPSVFEALGKIKTLVHLTLDHVSVLREENADDYYDDYPGDFEFDFFIEWLKKNKTLTSVQLSGYSGVDSSKLLALLAVNQTISSMSFRDVDFVFPPSMVDLTEALKVNTTLTSFELSDSEIGDDVVVALAEALKTNTTLLTLRICANEYVGEDGAVALANALKNNKTLEILDLSSCQIGDKGGVAIGEALSVNTGLRKLIIDNNEMGTHGQNAIHSNQSTRLEVSCQNDYHTDTEDSAEDSGSD